MLFTVSSSESAYPIIPAKSMKLTLYDHFEILVYFVHFLSSKQQ